MVKGLIEFERAPARDVCLSMSVALAVSSMVMMSTLQALAQKACYHACGSSCCEGAYMRNLSADRRDERRFLGLFAFAR